MVLLILEACKVAVLWIILSRLLNTFGKVELLLLHQVLAGWHLGHLGHAAILSPLKQGCGIRGGEPSFLSHEADISTV